MKIEALKIKNFRGIQNLEVSGLGDTIIIAGQNGSGKSCLFDAIRLLKSTYGGYQQNEWQNFFGEFAIQLTGSVKNLRGLFNNPSESIEIEAVFTLRPDEKTYIAANASELLEETTWQALIPEAFQFGGYQKALFAAQFRDRKPEVMTRVTEDLSKLKAELAAPSVTGRISIGPEGTVEIYNTKLLTVAFSNYRPRQIGLIDYHGAQRHYGRENVQGINLSLDQANQQYSANTLYNYNNKYSNVKSEMAGNYIKEILAERAVGRSVSDEIPLSQTLTELFESFFPDKKFEGPKPNIDGSLAFPVSTANGSEHDLDELSSGEKEILYGYLRIRSSAPKNSIILLDEPELHLNPRLIRGLPDFYRRHLSEALQNQLWLITHSDALIREAVGKPGFNVFHMVPCGVLQKNETQLRALSVHADLDAALTDLVGDLAAYRPGGKGLILEGGGESDFDRTVLLTLFSNELKGFNVISGSNKARVKALHEVLEKAYQDGTLPTKFYAIVDRDSDELAIDSGAVTRFKWDVYHIENYLLDIESIKCVLADLGQKEWSDNQIKSGLEKSARLGVEALVQHKLKTYVNSCFIKQIDFGFDPSSKNPTNEIFQAASRSAERISKALLDSISEQEISSFEHNLRKEIAEGFTNGDWVKNIPGRSILRTFVSQENLPVNYEVFRNLILNKILDTGRTPSGMKAIIDMLISS